MAKIRSTLSLFAALLFAVGLTGCRVGGADYPPGNPTCTPWQRRAHSEIAWCTEAKSPAGLSSVDCQYERAGGRLWQRCHAYDGLGGDLYWECTTTSGQEVLCTDKVSLHFHHAEKFRAEFQLP